MFKFVCSWTFSVVLLFPTPVHADSGSNFIDSVAFIRIGTGRCSGALIAPDLILTAGHCVFGLRTVDVRFKGDKSWIEGKVIALTKRNDMLVGNDLGLIRLNKSVDRTRLSVLDADKDLKVGDSVETVGHRQNRVAFNYSKGLVTAFRENSIVLEIEAGFGNSGGPVVNGQGQIVGIVSVMSWDGVLKSGDVMIGAVGHRAIHKFLSEVSPDQELSLLDAWTIHGLQVGYTADKVIERRIAHSLDIGYGALVLDRLQTKLGLRIGNHSPEPFVLIGLKLVPFNILTLKPYIMSIRSNSVWSPPIVGYRQDVNIGYVEVFGGSKGYGLSLGIELPLFFKR
jgi:protease YdgD